MIPRSGVVATLLGAFGALTIACDREHRRIQGGEPPPSERVERQSGLQPGPVMREPASAARLAADFGDDYQENAFEIAEGKRLFEWMNCVGCHARGGGGIGPPLMDAGWIYGSDPAAIRETILQGRPNGMPSFAGKLTGRQTMQLVAYVRTLSGLAPKAARPGRSDAMAVRPSEHNLEVLRPRPDTVPARP